MKIIDSIEKGVGEGSTWFKIGDPYKYSSFGDKITEIKEEQKIIKYIAGDPMDSILVYRGYDKDNNLLFEIGACADLTIRYKTE